MRIIKKCTKKQLIQRINELEKILKKKNSLSVNNEIYRQINQ